MDTIRRCDYFSMDTAHKVGEGARLLGALRDEGVNLLAFTGFPKGRRAQVDFIPADTAQFRLARRKPAGERPCELPRHGGVHGRSCRPAAQVPR